MDNLKPCPFCGGEAEVNHYNHVIEWMYEVRCPYCGCGTDGNKAEYGAIEAWNRRVE